MKIKKYIAPNMPEAMKKIRAELGAEAVILNSKIVHTGGVLGFFTKKNIEVLAAIDPSPLNNLQLPKEKSRPIQSSMGNYNQTMPVVIKESKAIESETEKKNTDANLKKEIDELKSLIKDLSITQQTDQATIYPKPIKKLEQKLIQQEVDGLIRNELMTSMTEYWFEKKQMASEQDMDDWLRQLLLDRTKQYQHGGISFTKKFINVVGPTGVGKTTTLAKIAANCVIKHKKKVAFITTDTYRIAAIEQLKTYAKILDVPIEVCYTEEDLSQAKEAFALFDLVFIDTAGRNFRNSKYVEDLNKLINFPNEMETFLVLSLTSKISDMIEIIDQFRVVDIHRIIFTKIDETTKHGAILTLMSTYNKGIAYMTTGQNVPDDIVEATPDNLVNTILGEEIK